MGLDGLDMLFRLEKSFGLQFDKGFWDRLPQGEAEPVPWWRFDQFATRSLNPKWRYERRKAVVTAGDLHSVVCAILAEKGMTIPPDSWQRVRKVLSDVTGHGVGRITTQTLLFQDLGLG